MYNDNTCMDITSNTDLHKKVCPKNIDNSNYRMYNNQFWFWKNHLATEYIKELNINVLHI